MAELRSRDRHGMAGRPPRPEERVRRDTAEGDDDAEAVAEDLDLPLEVRLTARELLAGGPVRGRGAPHGRGDAAIGQRQSVVPRDGRGPVREARPVQGAIQPLPAPVPGEHPPRPVPPVGRGREAHDQEARVRVPEPGEGSTPILPVAERRPLLMGDPLAVRDEPRALPARDDPGVQRIERGGLVLHGPSHAGMPLPPCDRGPRLSQPAGCACPPSGGHFRRTPWLSAKYPRGGGRSHVPQQTGPQGHDDGLPRPPGAPKPRLPSPLRPRPRRRSRA